MVSSQIDPSIIQEISMIRSASIRSEAAWHRGDQYGRRRRLALLSAAALVLHHALSTASFSSLPLRTRFNIYYDSNNNLHRDISYHPEQPARIDACIDALVREHHDLDMNQGIRLQIYDVAPSHNDDSDTSSGSTCIQHRPFTEKELGRARDMLVLAHSEEYVQRIERKCRDCRERRVEEGKDPLGFVGYIDDGDTYLTTESFDVLLRATAAWIRAVNAVMEGRSADGDTKPASLPTAAMALTRPPGHHATCTTANGFCVFNFAAAAALHAIKSGLAQRLSIWDWDVHYGQGVADILQHHDSMRYVSMHQYPAFPYMGQKRGVLSGGKGNILTVPVPPDSSWTCGYKDPYENLVLPFVYEKDVWEPDLIIICAGYDALNSDELASCNLNAADYGKMTRLLRERVAAGSSGGGSPPTDSAPGIVLGLEGGYQLKDGAAGGNLQDAVLETIMGFALLVPELNSFEEQIRLNFFALLLPY